MKNWNWVGGLLLLTITGFAQQFKISEYEEGKITIEYPPCFDGAYLFVEATTNLAADVWEVVDYTQVELTVGEPITYSPPVEAPASPWSTNVPTDVPYEITTEYLEAVSLGEVENSSWTARSVWQSTQSGNSKYFIISGISFEDSDGDGVDNLTEHASNSNPYERDAPPVSFPPDDCSFWRFLPDGRWGPVLSNPERGFLVGRKRACFCADFECV